MKNLTSTGKFSPSPFFVDAFATKNNFLPKFGEKKRKLQN